MEEIVKHINDTNASYRDINAGNAKNTDLFLDQEHKEFFKGYSSVKVRLHKDNLAQAILFISSILPRKYDRSGEHNRVNFSYDFVYDNLLKLDGFFNGETTKLVEWVIRTNSPQKNGKIDERFYLNNLIEEFSYNDINGNITKSKFIIRDYLAGGYSDIHFQKNSDNDVYDVIISNTTNYTIDKEEDEQNFIEDKTISHKDVKLQQIIYGAPGTGKSHQIKKDIANSPHFRTTFHPDSDYSSFVGAYKPTITTVDVRDVTGKVIIENDNKVKEDKIIYKYVAQVFLKAYTAAWKSYPQQQYLIIEEINRGNCAQIFGDLFQLLDRNGSGFSDYPIHADDDIRVHIYEEFLKCKLCDTDKIKINTIYAKEYDDVMSKIANGEVLLLPSNLSIWATMNTSDQSLFPIDSAFKRRWDWKYIPISNANKGWFITANDKKYDWWSFLEKINDKIDSITDSEDKKLGYFFVKAEEEQTISSDKFVGKVIFYLWNDVFKNIGFDDEIFNDTDDLQKLTFQKFFNADGKANEKKIQIFLDNLGVTILRGEEIDIEEETDDSTDSTKNSTRYSINGNGKFAKRLLAVEMVKLFVEQNLDVTASEVIEAWKQLSDVTHFVENQEEYEGRTEDGKKRAIDVACNDGTVVWVSTHGWITKTIESLIDTVNNKGWNIHVEKL